jgi:hypothetical protein
MGDDEEEQFAGLALLNMLELAGTAASSFLKLAQTTSLEFCNIRCVSPLSLCVLYDNLGTYLPLLLGAQLRAEPPECQVRPRISSINPY